MPITIFPNQGVRRSSPYVATPSRPRSSDEISARVQTKLLAQLNTKEAYSGHHDLFDIYTVGPTMLKATFVSRDLHRPIYDVTTDVVGNTSVTILWCFDRTTQTVREVARISRARGGKAFVEMSGVKVPVADFLKKSKWRIGSSYPSTQTFTSQTDEYKWIPETTSFVAESCVWKCVSSNTSSKTVDGNTPLATYTPQLSRTAYHPHSNERSYTPLGRTATTLSSRRSSISTHSIASTTGSSRRHLATLGIHPEVDSRPQLCDILVLTMLLVLVSKEEWRSLGPLGIQTTSAESVLARLVVSYGTH